jgi:hypothetical protein
MLDPAHRALLEEVRRRIELASDDPKVLNSDGRTSWRGPRVRMAVENRADDGLALVKYIRGVLRKRVGPRAGTHSWKPAGSSTRLRTWWRGHRTRESRDCSATKTASLPPVWSAGNRDRHHRTAAKRRRAADRCLNAPLTPVDHSELLLARALVCTQRRSRPVLIRRLAGGLDQRHSP